MKNVDHVEATLTRAQRVRAASRERRDQQKQELRRTILAAAADLFVEQGYERFSLRQVAERIGYSPTTIYLYFQNKDDLLFAVVYDGWQRFTGEFRVAAGEGGDPVERLRAMGRCYTRFGMNNPALYDLMFVQRDDFLLHENLDREGKPVDLLGVLQSTIAEAIDGGYFRPGSVETYSDAIWAATHGVVSLCPDLIGKERRERAIELVLAMTLDGLRAPQENCMPPTAEH